MCQLVVNLHRAMCAVAMGAFALAPGLRAEDKLPSPHHCDLNVAKLTQAQCLLSQVARYGELGPPLSNLPPPWPALLGDAPRRVPAVPAMRSLLSDRGINEADLGGSLDAPVSRTARGERARYFIIHDTSAPTLPAGGSGFPLEINGEPWSEKYLKQLSAAANAHVFVGRTGKSRTAVGFDKPLLTTKFERNGDRTRLVGMFLGVENLQPRRLDAKGIDSIAPVPGFTPPQLQRLALIYVAASVRAGTWLVPVYHAVLDGGIKNAHDDPQDFDLQGFSAAVLELLDVL